jgi:hypothetical protein
VNTVEQQRQQSRTDAQRAAEWANDLASSTRWLVDCIRELEATTESTRLIVEATIGELDKMHERAIANANRAAERALAIGDAIAAAARPKPTRGGTL